ncbi:autophagy- protein 2 [Dipsacomyces acuminosporus]|nr:autophagy- protein 2 [Dipsacomyces acuminosporus]
MWPSNWSVTLPSWAVSNSLQKRLVKFLLRRTVGQFLKTELDDEHIDVQLSSGQMQLRNVELSEEALNDAISGLPIVVRSGVVGRISVSVPWTQLWTGHCKLQIEELAIQTELLDENSKDGEPDNMELKGNEKLRTGRTNLAESVAMTEGGASILTSSVFIADDFLRDETLGYGEKDRMFINKDVERMVANAHEERAQFVRSRNQSSGGHAPSMARFPWASDGGQKAKHPSAVDEVDDDIGDGDGIAHDMPPTPASPGGPIRGLQVVSEMVDRIISAVNISVKSIKVECAVSTHEGGKGLDTKLQLLLDSVEFKDDVANRQAASAANTLRESSSRENSSGNVSADGSGSGSNHPAGIEYKVVKFHTLAKLVELKGLRLSILPLSDSSMAIDELSSNTILSSFNAPISAHLRLHRQLPFSELAPVQPAESRTGRRRSSNSESIYMGPMPGEFREMKPEQEAYESATRPPAHAGTRARNRVGEDPTTSGWDLSIELGDVACILTEPQLATLYAIARAAAPVFKQKAEQRAMRNRYQEKYGDRSPDDLHVVVPQLAQWVGVKCRHLYAAVLASSTRAYQGWQDSSLAVIRLKLETEKHLAMYLKRIGLRWESTPSPSINTAPADGTPIYMDTEFWAAMTRDAAAAAAAAAAQMGDKHQESSKPTPGSGGDGLATVSAFVQSFSLYDNDPHARPVVLPLVTIDRSLAAPGNRSSGQDVSSSRVRNSEKYDIWMCASEADLVLSVNVGPIVIALNKEFADRLGAYQRLVNSITRPQSAPQQQPLDTGIADYADGANVDGVTRSIEDLMRNLRLEAEQKMPSNLALCSPLIRTWVLLPNTIVGSPQTQRRHHGRNEDEAPGHFCIDAVDAVITNVVNGTATSSQAQEEVPEGHMRHPHIQELLESRKSVAGSGIRLECETLQIYAQSMEGSSAINHIASVHGPSNSAASFHEAVSIPRPHIEITTVAKAPRQPAYGSAVHEAHNRRKPPAFDAFSAVDDDIRVRMAPESELTTSIEFERQAVAHSRLVISCHLPEAKVILNKPVYQRLNGIINEFLLWQSRQEELREAGRSEREGGEEKEDIEAPGISVLVDVPLMLANISTGDIQVNDGKSDAGIEIPSTSTTWSQGRTQQGRSYVEHCDVSQRIKVSNTRLFLSNALIEKGRVYISAESNQLRLSSFEGDSEAEVTLSHSFATHEAPIITPQLSLYMLTSPSMYEESEVVVKTTWTTFDFSRESSCLSDLEAFFSSSGTSGLVQPPPKPMRLSLNVLNSSFRWSPSVDPGLRSAAISVDSLAVIVGLNSPAPDRDREELHYYVEGLSVYGKPADSLVSTPAHISSDAWVSTGRFWRDHGYSMLLHTDMVDLASKTKEGEDGPLLDLKLYGEALILDACADSVGTLPLILQELVNDVKGEVNGSRGAVAAHAEQGGAEPQNAADRKAIRDPQVIEQVTDDIFGDIEEDTFALAAESYGNARRLSVSQLSADDYSFTYDFEHGRDDIGALVMDEYFAPHAQPDIADEYEVVSGGKALSPSSTMQPSYSRRSQPSVSGKQVQRMEQPSAPKLPSKRASGRLLDNRASKGKSVDKGATSSKQMDEFGDYVDMVGHSDLSSEEGEAAGYSTDDSIVGYSRRSSHARQHPSKSRYPGHGFIAADSVVLEPEGGRSSHPAQSRDQHRLADQAPRAELIEIPSQNDIGPVKVSVPQDGGEGSDLFKNSKSRKPDDEQLAESEFGIIEDYFAAPTPGEMSQDERSSADDSDNILCFALSIGRVEVNLYSGQDWLASPELPAKHAPADPAFMPSYLDDINEAPSSVGGSIYERTSASLPETRGPMGSHLSPGDSPQSPHRPFKLLSQPERRSAKPKIKLRATHAHVEFKRASEASATAYDLGLNIGMLEILDELETSEWSKFLTRRRDAKTGLPATLHTLANTQNRQMLVSGTADSDRVTSRRMRSQGSSKWPASNAEPMISIQVESVRPYAALSTEELRADVEVSPLRCYIHQDALDFFIGFFEAAEKHGSEVRAIAKGQSNAAASGGGLVGRARRLRQRPSNANQPYFQIVRIAPLNVIFDYKPRRMRVSSGSSNQAHVAAAAAAAVGGNGRSSSSSASSPTNASAGSAGPSRKPVELLNLFPLEDAEMTLRTVKVRGVAGISRLVRELASAWLPHLTQTQIPGVVAGMTPIRSLVNIGSGVADLVILPLEQYRKDGRLVQGIKRGAQSFARTTALEAIQLGAKVAVNAQTLLEQAGDILNVDVASGGDSGSAPHSHDGRLESGSALSPRGLGDGSHSPIGFPIDLADWPDFASVDGTEYGDGRGSSRSSSTRPRSFSASKYARQPENLSEGMRQAYMSLRSNMGDAVQTILAIPVVVQEGESGGEGGGPGRAPVHGSVRAVVRAVPVAVLKPMIGATEAVSKTLLGLRNTMEPTRKVQLGDKYKSRKPESKHSNPL